MYVEKSICVEKSLYLAEILVYGLNYDVVERDAIELGVVEGLVLQHPGVKRLWHSAANALYGLTGELSVALRNLVTLRRVEARSLFRLS